MTIIYPEGIVVNTKNEMITNNLVYENDMGISIRLFMSFNLIFSVYVV